MATDQFRLDLALGIRSMWQDVPPRCCLRLDQEMFWDDVLVESKTLALSRHLDRGSHALEIELLGKPDCDPHQALIIENLGLGRIESARFLWLGVYTPRYPEPWASQQKQKGVLLESCLRNTDHLGWNGVWRLEFSVPIFTWIHEIENLGWIYD